MSTVYTPARPATLSARLATLWNARATLVVLWLGVCLALVGNLVISHPWRNDGTSGADFHTFYTAAVAIWNHQDPYTHSIAVYRAVFADTGVPQNVFLYPPPFAVALILLTFLPSSAALLIWTALTVALFIGMIAVLARMLLPQDWLRWTALLVIACSLTAMFRNEIKNGQVDILLTSFVVGSYYAYAHKRPTLAGVLMALAILVKPFLGLLLLFFLRKHSFRPIISAAVTGLIGFAVSFLILGWQPLLEWVSLVRSISQVPYTALRYLVSLQAFLLRFIAAFHPYAPWNQQPVWIATAAAWVLGIGSGLLVLGIVRHRTRSEEQVALEFALFVSWMLLVFPGIEDIHVISIFIPLTLLALAAWRLYQQGKVGKWWLAGVGICFLYFMNPLLPRWQWAGYVSPITGILVWETGAYLPVLALVFGTLCVLLWKTRASEASGTRHIATGVGVSGAGLARFSRLGGSMANFDEQEARNSGQPQTSAGMLGRLAAPIRSTLPGPYHMLRMTRHKIRAQQLRRVLDVVLAKGGLRVQSGPFKGMLYTQSVIDSALAVPRALGSALTPKLLGCYEVELQERLEGALATPYQEVVDIGSAEGYYAVGLALRLPAARVHAFEMDPLRQKLCAEMAQVNGVAERVVVDGACDGEKLAALTSGHPFILCDCEGYELELLQPDLIPGLKGCDLLVELHDSANPIISRAIVERFTPTHEVTVIQSAETDPAQYPALAALSEKDRYFAVSEERPAGMKWAFLKARSAT